MPNIIEVTLVVEIGILLNHYQNLGRLNINDLTFNIKPMGFTAYWYFPRAGSKLGLDDETK